MKPSEVLDICAEKFRLPNSWCQYASAKFLASDYKNPMRCSIGMLTSVTFAFDSRPDRKRDDLLVYDLAESYLSRSLQYKITSWNDTVGRTQQEIVEGFKAAAELARSEGN